MIFAHIGYEQRLGDRPTSASLSFTNNNSSLLVQEEVLEELDIVETSNQVNIVDPSTGGQFPAAYITTTLGQLLGHIRFNI